MKAVYCGKTKINTIIRNIYGLIGPSGEFTKVYSKNSKMIVGCDNVAIYEHKDSKWDDLDDLAYCFCYDDNTGLHTIYRVEHTEDTPNDDSFEKLHIPWNCENFRDLFIEIFNTGEYLLTEDCENSKFFAEKKVDKSIFEQVNTYYNNCLKQNMAECYKYSKMLANVDSETFKDDNGNYTQAFYDYFNKSRYSNTRIMRQAMLSIEFDKRYIIKTNVMEYVVDLGRIPMHYGYTNSCGKIECGSVKIDSRYILPKQIQEVKENIKKQYNYGFY